MPRTGEPEPIVIDPKTLDELTRRVTAGLPPGLDRVGRDVRNNLRAVLASAFERMDLVTREEFDVQSAVLLRTREKLTALETRVAELEAAAGSAAAAPQADTERGN